MDIVKSKRGFTLIELLVVIAIIALLLSILMPTLGRVKEAGKRIHCLANVKTLSMGYMMYLDAYEGKLPLGASPAIGVEAWCNRVASPYEYNPLDAPKELQIASIEEGLLFPYVEDAKVYRCPIAEKNEFRTYGISMAMNFPTIVVDQGTRITKITQVKNTAGRMLFLDDYVNDWNASWYVPATAQYWWNSTPIRHGSGGNVFSFVDGHSEFHDWKDQRTIDLAELCYKDRSPEARNRPGNAPGEQADNEDLIWAARAQWGMIEN